ncbi:MAG: phosphate ABC transporter permease subunit PstC [Oligoflexia bacterium]|nr:phosphate ABC transporter permease subunit PstC [Oligoflexia bacterium]
MTTIAKRPKDVHLGDRVFALSLKSIAAFVGIMLIAIGFFLAKASIPALNNSGFAFFVTSVWDPVQNVYGALPVIFGTIVSSLTALMIAGPMSVGVALFLTELAPAWIASVFGFLVQMLAAIPSVVYGLWGIFVLAPWMRETVQPTLSSSLGFLPLFQGPPYGVGMLTASLILAIMITPTIASICQEVFKAVPTAQRESALALGSTRWEMMKLAVLKTSKPGIFGAIILGLGRAFGETMAVTMVIGNRSEISFSLFAPGQTMASVIANEYAEATHDLHLSALAAVGLALFIVTIIINGTARVLISRITFKRQQA